MKNLAWNREGLILALVLYFHPKYRQIHDRYSEVHKRSDLETRQNEQNGFEKDVDSIPIKQVTLKRFSSWYCEEKMKASSKLKQHIVLTLKELKRKIKSCRTP